MVELRTVLKADPRNPYGYYFLGVAFFETGELAAARDAYSACLKLAPEYIGARVALSHVLRMLGDASAAVREGMAALRLAPGDGDAIYAVALAHLALGEPSVARRYLQAFLETRPEFEVSVQARAVLEQLKSPAERAAESEEEDEDDEDES